MSIEYLPGLKPGDKIDLDQLPSRRFEKERGPRPESYRPELRERLRYMAARLNDEYDRSLCSHSGHIETGDRADQEAVSVREEAWAAEQGKDREEWRADREKSPSGLAEMALTVLFDKILRDDFIVVRASEYDDYENGADQLIIDKETGAVICGLDDVLGHVGDDGGEKKAEKIARKMKSGGATIKYGATVEHGRLVSKSLRHIPMFYFSLSKEELGGLLPAVSGDSADLARTEKEVFSKLVDSLVEQSEKFSRDESLHPKLREKLKSFYPSLSKILDYKQNL